MSIGSAVGTAQRPQKRSAQVFRYPAPQGGVDARQAVGNENLQTCVYTYNLLPFEYGMRVREGYREWQKDIIEIASTGVNTLIPYDADDEGGTGDRLFAVTNEGIWNVTDYAAAPELMATFPLQVTGAGYGTFCHYTDDAGVNILYYADKLNGLYDYDPVGGTWQATTGIDGVDPATVKFVVLHKARIWFAQSNSADAWYLEVGAKKGTATVFHLGSKFKHGGSLEGIFNWSVDGGQGLDDLLVFVGHAGDVIVYEGEDPTTADWSAIGTYYVGELPDTPRFGTEQGGELYLLSVFGVTSMGDLLKGVDTNILQADVSGSSIAAKIGGVLRERMKLSIDQAGWDIANIPCEGGMLISTPPIGSEAPIQYYYNFTTQSWGFWRDVPINCFQEYEGAVVFGTDSSTVCRMDVTVDNVLIDPIEGELNGVDIQFSILSAFSALEAPALYKRPKLIRPDFLSTLEPQHMSVCRFDFNVAEGPAPSTGSSAVSVSGIWGESGVGPSNWDQAVWGSSTPVTFPTVGGVWGHGRYVAIATRGSCRSRTRLVGWDFIYDIGGPML